MILDDIGYVFIVSRAQHGLILVIGKLSPLVVATDADCRHLQLGIPSWMLLPLQAGLVYVDDLDSLEARLDGLREERVLWRLHICHSDRLTSTLHGVVWLRLKLTLM